jgi:Fur family ferric uptake transcriptional regulator
MSHHHHTHDLDAVVERLRERGERITYQRRLVIEALTALQTHVTLQDVCAYLQRTYADVQLSETTIYRILQWLKDVGVVAQTDLGQSGVTYAWLSSPAHHHLVCLQCGKVMQIDDVLLEPLRQRLRTTHQFEARIDHMAIYGMCEACQEGEK